MNMRQFENDVKMYGTQTREKSGLPVFKFENDVKMYGTQTATSSMAAPPQFENDVKMYGTQTVPLLGSRDTCLRMM